MCCHSTGDIPYKASPLQQALHLAERRVLPTETKMATEEDELSNPGSQQDENQQKLSFGGEDDDGDDDDEDDEDDVSDVSNEDDSLTDDDDGGEHLYTLDHYDEENLPEYSCRYCGIHDPACVAKCVETKKWFCNAVIGSGGSHLVHHLVRSRSNQVQLHPESPLGDTVLECYNCASKNSFVLGFVPASSSSVVVLLCRVCVETVPALKDMDWELAQWHPLIQDRKFLPWLIKV